MGDTLSSALCVGTPCCEHHKHPKGYQSAPKRRPHPGVMCWVGGSLRSGAATTCAPARPVIWALAYVAPTSARAKRLFKSLLKPQLAHGSAPLFKPGLILALSVGPCGG
jgi:hypothetical protein